MPQSDYNVKADERITLSASYTYSTYEREQTRKFLLSSTQNSAFIRSTSTGSDPESTPILHKSTGSGGSSSQFKCRSVLVMIACLYLQFAAFGLVVALGVIYVELIDALNALRADAALIQSIYMGTTLGGGVLFTKVFERYNPGACVVIASLIGATALAGSAFSESVVALIVLIGVILGIVMGCSTLATFVTVSQTFTTNRKFALGILTFGSTIGQITIPFVTYALIEAFYWNGALLVMSSLIVLNCVPCGLVIYFSTKRLIDVKKKTENRESKSSSIFKDPLFYFYILMYLIFLTFAPVEQWFSADLAVLKGFSFQEGSMLLSVNGGAGVCGRFLGTFLIKVFKDARPEIYLIIGYAAWAASHISLSLAMDYWLLVLAMILRGLSAGLVAAFLPSMQIELSGVERFAITVAVSNFVGGSGEIIGGYIGGYTVDVTGNYSTIFFIATISAALCSLSYVVIYFVLARRRRKQTSVPYKSVA